MRESNRTQRSLREQTLFKTDSFSVNNLVKNLSNPQVSSDKLLDSPYKLLYNYFLLKQSENLTLDQEPLTL